MHPLPGSDHYLLSTNNQRSKEWDQLYQHERDFTRAVFSSAAARKRAASLARSSDSSPRLQLLPAQRVEGVDPNAEVQKS